MRLGLVEYTGGRTAAFSVEIKGIKEHLWAKGLQRESVKQRRWLPEDEARAYERFPDFAILRWGTDESTSIHVPTGRPSWQMPNASHVSEFFQSPGEQATPEKLPVIASGAEPEFIMSKGGVVHKKGCSYAKRVSDPIGFQTLEEAAVHEHFQKYCKCILGE